MKIPFTRKTMASSRKDFKRRVHKLLEMANIKIGSVLSDIFGATGQNLIRLLLSKKPIALSDVEERLRGKLASKRDREKKTFELYDAIEGFFGDHEEILGAKWPCAQG